MKSQWNSWISSKRGSYGSKICTGYGGGVYQKALTDVIVSDVEGLIRELSIVGKSDIMQVDVRKTLMTLDELKQEVLKNKKWNACV